MKINVINLFINNKVMVFGVILLFVIPWMGILVIIINAIYKLVTWFQKKNKERINLMKMTLVSEAEKYIELVEKNKALPTIQTSVFMDQGEHSFLEEKTDLLETRSVRSYSGGGRGVSFRVAKGVSVGMGGYSGTSYSKQEWNKLDSGILILTSSKLIFMGDKETRSIPIKKVLAMESMLDGIRISVDSRKKSIKFSVHNGLIWSAAIGIIRSGENPLSIEKKLNVQLQVE